MDAFRAAALKRLRGRVYSHALKATWEAELAELVARIADGVERGDPVDMHALDLFVLPEAHYSHIEFIREVAGIDHAHDGIPAAALERLWGGSHQDAGPRRVREIIDAFEPTGWAATGAPVISSAQVLYECPASPSADSTAPDAEDQPRCP